MHRQLCLYCSWTYGNKGIQRSPLAAGLVGKCADLGMHRRSVKLNGAPPRTFPECLQVWDRIALDILFISMNSSPVMWLCF